MTRGTVVVVGAKGREGDLLQARLEKDGYELVSMSLQKFNASKITKSLPQAVLVTDNCTPNLVQQVVGCVRKFKTKVPVIMVTTDAESDKFTQVKGIGEVWRLHSISLAEAMRRLRFAVELCRIA